MRAFVLLSACHGHGSEPATNHSVDSGFGYERRRTISVREQRADPRGKEMSVPMPSRSRYVLAVLLFGFFFEKFVFGIMEERNVPGSYVFVRAPLINNT